MKLKETQDTLGTFQPAPTHELPWFDRCGIDIAPPPYRRAPVALDGTEDDTIMLEAPAPTSLVHLKAFPGVWLKCEHENPTGSHKDRAYYQMLTALGTLADETCLVEYTTGNGGISLARFARQLGRRAVVFMPKGMTPERATLIEGFGAQLVQTPADLFVAGARQAAEDFVRQEGNAVLLGQSDNLANQHAFHQVGKEMIATLLKRGIRPRLFACAIGTGGTFSGIAAVLKGEIHGLEAIAIEVPEAALLWAKRNHCKMKPTLPSIIGMGAGAIAPNTDERLVDDVALVNANDVREVRRALFAVDRLDLGPSTAANVLVASRFAGRYREPVVTVSFDRGDRYRSCSGRHGKFT